MSVAGPDQGGVEGGDGPAEVEGGLGVRQVVAGTATGAAAGGEDHLLAEVLLGVPRPGGGTVLMRAEFLMANVGSPTSSMSLLFSPAVKCVPAGRGPDWTVVSQAILGHLVGCRGPRCRPGVHLLHLAPPDALRLPDCVQKDSANPTG